jgi:hypothetical protein
MGVVIGLIGLFPLLGCGGGDASSEGGEETGSDSSGDGTSEDESTGTETEETGGAEETGVEETGEETGGGDVCEPGIEIVCQCPDNSPGVLTCLPNGTGYSSCACEDEPIFCEPGSSLDCPCPGDPTGGPWEGEQPCLEDGSGWTECVCGFQAVAGVWRVKFKEASECVDFSVLSTKLFAAGHAVVTIAEDGTAALEFHDQTFNEFKEVLLPDGELTEEGVYRASLPVTEFDDTPNCKVNSGYVLELEKTVGGMQGSFSFSETKKGGGCFTDGCEGEVELTATPLGDAPDAALFSSPFAYNYSNPIDGLSETGEIVLYPIEDHPHYLLFDIYTPGTQLNTIRGLPYIIGASGKLTGRAYAYVVDEGCNNVDLWDLDMTMKYGAEFGGTVEHRDRFHWDCDDASETLSIGTFTP